MSLRGFRIVASEAIGAAGLVVIIENFGRSDCGKSRFFVEKASETSFENMNMRVFAHITTWECVFWNCPELNENAMRRKMFLRGEKYSLARKRYPVLLL